MSDKDFKDFLFTVSLGIAIGFAIIIGITIIKINFDIGKVFTFDIFVSALMENKDMLAKAVLISIVYWGFEQKIKSSFKNKYVVNVLSTVVFFVMAYISYEMAMERYAEIAETTVVYKPCTLTDNHKYFICVGEKLPVSVDISNIKPAITLNEQIDVY